MLFTLSIATSIYPLWIKVLISILSYIKSRSQFDTSKKYFKNNIQNYYKMLLSVPDSFLKFSAASLYPFKNINIKLFIENKIFHFLFKKKKNFKTFYKKKIHNKFI